MSYIKTWVERCDEHPDHQSGMVSNGIIQARMQEEIDDLRAEIERLREAMTDMLGGWRYIRETYGDLAGVGWDRVEQKARNALEGKP